MRLSSICSSHDERGVSARLRITRSSEPPALLIHTSSRPELDGRRRKRLVAILGAHIGLDRDRPPAEPDDDVGDLLDLVSTACTDDDVGSGRGQPEGDPPADATARTGDDGDVAVEAEAVEDHDPDGRAANATGRACRPWST